MAHPPADADARHMWEFVDLLIALTFYGTAYGMILYCLAVGLSVTLGLMRFVNLAHGVFAMMGGYLTVTAMSRLGFAFLPAVAVSVVAVGAAGDAHRANALPASLCGADSGAGALLDWPHLRLERRGQVPLRAAGTTDRTTGVAVRSASTSASACSPCTGCF